jgi:hemerythrin superfamily protein
MTMQFPQGVQNNSTFNNNVFAVETNKKELNKLISSLSYATRQYDTKKTEKDLHNLIESLVAIDLKLLDFINFYDLNPSQYNVLNYPLIDLYSVKLFDDKNLNEFKKNICLCYNIITNHFEKLEKYNNVIFDMFSKKFAE